MDHFVWLAILFCITQSALFSGLNLAVFSLPRLRLEIEGAQKNKQARKILELRKDSNFLLATILWGNVAINVLLALLSDSVMTGVLAFVFSTVVITFLGEIFPQAYFSKHAMRMGSLLTPVLRFYQLILFPVAKPSGLLLDALLGKEGIFYFREHYLSELIRRHIWSPDSDVGEVEGEGALNFLILDDLPVAEEGQELEGASVIRLPFENGQIRFPDFEFERDDPFVRQILSSGERWVVFVDTSDKPRLVMDSDAFIRQGVILEATPDPMRYCFEPVVIEKEDTLLGDVLDHLRERIRREKQDDLSRDVIIVWGKARRIISGSDILERLFRPGDSAGTIPL